MPASTVHVPLDRPYDVTTEPGALDRLPETLRTLAPGRRAMLAIDHNLPPDHVASVADAIRDAGYTVCQHTIEAFEDRKTLRTFGELLRAAAEAGLERSDPWIALGGGIVGDLAGYAAASYQRGAPVIQCPTTLLAMVDASVGGKTAVNLSIPQVRGDDLLLKNYAGAFWQPRAVLADVSTLRSLPDREMRCGLAECLKHAIIDSANQPDLLDRTVKAVASALDRDELALQELVATNAAIKVKVLVPDVHENADPETGGRALLNLGHTFAHAIEPVPELSLKHGEAVALGMAAATKTAELMGVLDREIAKNIVKAIDAAGLPITIKHLPQAITLIERMRSDKKTRSGALRVVLPVTEGGCKVFSSPPLEALERAWDALRA